jgi:DNA-binding NarL/FixJ family response regulator
MKRGGRRVGDRPNPRQGGAVRVFELRYGGEDLLVLSAPLEGEPPRGLTPAELAVARAIARGATNAQIARERGTSVRTVANQVAAIFKRLGVGSRAQVAAALSRSGA